MSLGWTSSSHFYSSTAQQDNKVQNTSEGRSNANIGILIHWWDLA